MSREPWRDDDAPKQAPGLVAWERERDEAREARVAYDDALASGRFGRYLVYRLRGFAMSLTLGQLVHLAELWLLFQIFFGAALHTALAAKLASTIAGSFYWGVLDVFRRDLRADEQARARVAKAWWSLSLIVAVLGAVGVLIAAFFAEPWWDYVFLYVCVFALRAAADFPARTLYSVAYAHGRVARALWWSPAIDLAGLLVAWICLSWLGAYAVVISALLTTVATRALTIFTSARMLRQRELPRPKFSREALALIGPVLLDGPAAALRKTFTIDRSRSKRRRERLRILVTSGTSGLVMRAAELIALTVVLARTERADSFQVFLLFFLTSPLLGSCSGWAQTFYVDLVASRPSRLLHLRRQFVRRLLVAAPVVALFAWAMGVATLVFVDLHLQLAQWRSLLLTCVALAILCVAQFEAFAAGQFVRITIVGSLLAWVNVSIASSASLPPQLLGYALAPPLLVAAILMLVPLPWDAAAIERDTWAGAADATSRLRAPVQLWHLRLGDLSFMRTLFLADRIRVELAHAVVATPKRGRIVIAAPDARAAEVDPVRFAVLAAGRLVAIEHERCPDHRAAAATIARWRGTLDPPPNELRLQRALAAFPDAIVVDLLRAGAAGFAALPAEDRTHLLFALRGFGRPRLRSMAIAVLSERGAPRFVVLVRKQRGDEGARLSAAVS